MSKSKKDSVNSSNYITTVREGAIAANIFRGVTPDGHAYLYFSLSRSWKSANGSRQGYSDRFYERNASALQSVVNKACLWIEENPQAADAAAESDEVAAAA